MPQYPFTLFGVEIENREDLNCLGLHLAPDPNDPWTNLVPEGLETEYLPDAFIKKRARRSTVRQIEKETGRVVTAVTVAPDGSRTYALGEKADALNEWDQDLGTHPPQIRQ